MLIVGGGICILTQYSEDRKEVYNMTLEEVLTRFAEGLENVEDYDEDFEFLRGMNNASVVDSEEYKNLDNKYKELKDKYKKKFIDSLTKPVGETEEEEEEKEEKTEIKIEDLDLTGIND